jgi:hypothetical protein
MVAVMRGELNARLPRRYVAEIELCVWIHEPSSRRRRTLEPDVTVTDQGGPSGSGSVGIATSAPSTIVLPTVRRKKRKHVRIIDREAHRVVTAIELLSPSNKSAGDDRETYLLKRNDYLVNDVNLVEIDLLRGGTRLPLSVVPPEVHDYYAMVCRSWEYPRASFWNFSIRDTLPDLAIPLAVDVPDVVLPLRPCLDRAFDEGRYRERLPYDRPLRPRPRRQDAAWIRGLVTLQREP